MTLLNTILKALYNVKSVKDVPPDWMSHYLAMPTEVRDSLLEKQEGAGPSQTQANPVELTDGRWILPNNIIPDAVKPGGMYRGDLIDPAALEHISALTPDEVRALRPPDPEP